MFVPKAVGSHSTHKRRQRAGSDESVKPPKAKRPRSAPRQESIEPHPGTSGEVQHESALGEPNPMAADKAGAGKQIAIRGPKKAEPRDGGFEGSGVLSKTDFYIVSQLPALPDQISGLQSGSFRCTLGNGHGYALALTQSHAIIWPYSTSPPSPTPADIFTLPIPDSCRDPKGAIPLGVLLSTAASGVPGLLVVVPSTGKIIYWENVSSAASLGISRQKQNGLQGSISGLLSGEYATDILNGEPAGVFVTFSTGRVAHIAVRDPQGKPAVMAQFLRNGVSQRSGGLLGGIKSVLGGGSWRKDVAATRAGESHQRGQRDIIIATSAGVIEIWDTHWNSGSALKKQFDVKKDIYNSFQTDDMDQPGEQDVTILDAAWAASESSHELAASGEESWQLFLIVASGRDRNSKRLYVMQISLSASEIRIVSARPVDLHNIPAVPEDSKPRLLVPRAGDTVFVIIGQSVILMSVAPFEESPSSQLLSDSGRRPALFQDSINFRPGREYEILGTGIEDVRDGSSHPTCLVMVREFGVIRITSLPRDRTEYGAEEARVTAKDRLEQAVFYGSMRGNPLHLVSHGGLDFPAQEIEEAALEICRGLLRSQSKFIPTAIPLEQNLRARAKALDDLAALLMRQSGHLDRMVWWELLWSAEKLAAQRAMWKIEEGLKAGSGRKATFLGQVIGLMSEKFKTPPDAKGDMNDHVRHWFLYDTYRMEHVVPWIYNAIKAQKGHSSRQVQKMAEQILNASELSLAVLETAFRYRDENATRYGLNEEFFEDGVLSNGYENLPEFWTSQNMSYIETSHLLDLQLDICRAWVQRAGVGPEVPENEILRKVAKNSTRQIRVLGKMHCERVRWLSAQGDPGLIEESNAIEEAHTRQRKWHLFKLAGIGQLEDAINLAEKFRDMTVLVELIIELRDQGKSEDLAQSLSSKTPGTDGSEAGEIDRKFTHYFESFGEAWADAFFTRQISMGQSGILFSLKKFQPYVTQFLRKVPAYSRLRWINDVIGENDYNAAAQSLKGMAAESESDIWCHRVELSLAKLSRLASCEKDGTDESLSRSDIKHLENYAEIDCIQDGVHAHLQPALQGAIDQKAEIELAIECFGGALSQERPSLHEVLVDALTRVVTRQVLDPDQLVDLLTLIDLSQLPIYGGDELWGEQFFLALRVIQLSGYRLKDPLYHSALQKLVWRRCMIRDNWEARGKADGTSADGAETSGQDTALFHTLTHCLGEKHSEDSNQPALYIPQSASELQLSKSESEVLVSRFRSEQQIRIARDLDWENEVLCQYLGEGKLEFWFKTLLASARGLNSPGAIEAPGDGH